ncbi:Protein RER1 [Lachnellula suecica]|uniref:Protein RER1 n=1 Tax=Lachnellula suecica TaxID=602035 RepID=A0A8T9CIK0_9HELO|nr:Protein RER1 [Lachnellula suecica]
MDSAEPEQTPFAAVSAHTGRLSRAWLDKSTPYVPYRWLGTAGLLFVFFLRIFVAQGWYIVAYSLGIYLLNLFLAFLQPKFDPSNEAIDNDMEDGAAGGLPTKQDEEFRPFIRRLPEFKFWYSATRAIAIGFLCTWFAIFDVPVFWPVLVVYWLILFALTSKFWRSGVIYGGGLIGIVRRQIQHMIKYRYVPFSFGKAKYNKNSN